MNRFWLVRAVALLMLVSGMQAGALRGIDTGDERYYGNPETSTAVRPEARKSDVIPLPEPAAQPPQPQQWASGDALPQPGQLPAGARALPQHRVPDPTGPPRA
ncbi:MAG: hypothetical protein OEV81_17050 [Betaproteobacteria bacterium]|nr:hypothetical protein [Betaproteobacteria bacterium]MDH5221934.1 hypothetical protein [Betaproteobacteria bacterium]MDH5351291.1 hypothetical protein [Betaproteobacteria bacterium]